MFHLLLALTLAQLTCPDGICRPNPVAWRSRADDPRRVYLYVDGRQRGGYDRASDEWRDFDPDSQTWSDPRPLFAQPAEAVTRDFGVMRERLANRERFSLGGVPVSADDAREALAAIPDDSQQLRLTVIGAEKDRRAVLDDLEHHAALAPLRERILVQSYEPEHWAVAGAGFVTVGAPTIYLQAPDGRVLHRQDEYRGPERLAAALRKADPNYRPEADPDLDSQSTSLRLPRWACAGLAVLSLLLISRRRNP